MWKFISNLFDSGKSKSQINTNKISLEKIEEMFSHLKSSGVNTDQKMRWGYFFTAINSDSFDQVANELKAKKFSFVEVFQSENKIYWLHLERIECHNAKSLFQLDEELYEIADKFQIVYDGFEVGSVDKGKAIERNTYIVPEEYKTLDFQRDKYPCLLVGNIAFDRFPHKEEYCYFIAVTTAYENENNAMLPTKEELDELEKLELFIEKGLTEKNIKNYYIFRETHKGIRSFYIVTNDKVLATEVLKQINESGKQRPFEFEIITDKKWNLYNGFSQKVMEE